MALVLHFATNKNYTMYLVNINQYLVKSSPGAIPLLAVPKSLECPSYQNQTRQSILGSVYQTKYKLLER